MLMTQLRRHAMIRYVSVGQYNNTVSNISIYKLARVDCEGLPTFTIPLVDSLNACS